MDASYNNVGGINGGVFSSSVDKNGDIVLAQDKVKPKNKKIVCIIVAIVFLIIGGVIAGVLISKYFTSNRTFGEYRDLVLYGDGGEKKYPDKNNSYAIQAVVGNYDESDVSAYFSKIESVKDKIEESKRQKYEFDLEVIELWMKIVYFYNFYDSSIVNVYREGDDEAARQYISDEYGIFTNSKNEKITVVGEMINDAALAYLSFVEILDKNGCSLTVIDEACVDSDNEISLDIKNDVIIKSHKAFESGIWEMLREAVDDLVKGRG